MVLSSDSSVDLQIAALHSATSALITSSLPINRTISGLRIGRDEKGFKINPPLSKLDSGSLDFLLVGSGDEVMMIELAVKATKDFTNFDLSNLNLE